MATEEVKSGFINRRLAPKKKPKFMWFELHGSSLFSYLERHSNVPKRTFELQNSTINVPEKKLTIDIEKEGKLLISLTFSSKEDFDSWKPALENAITLDAISAPQKEKVKKDRGSVAMRAGKTVGGKITGSAIGKQAVKGIVNEEIKLLIVALKRIISKVEGQRRADEIESNVVKIVTKAFFLEKDKKITMEQFLEADTPLRESFELLVEMRDYRHRMRPDTLKERLHTVHNHLVQVEQILVNLLMPFLTPNSIKRIATTFGLLSSEEFLDQAWGDPLLEEDRDLLTDAMNRYTQFHF